MSDKMEFVCPPFVDVRAENADLRRRNQNLFEQLQQLSAANRAANSRVEELIEDKHRLARGCRKNFEEGEKARERVKELENLLEMKATPMTSAHEHELVQRVKELEDQRPRYSAVESENVRLQMRVKHQKTTIEGASEFIQQLAARLGKADARVRELEAQVKFYEEDRTRGLHCIERLTKERDQLHQRVRELENRLSQITPREYQLSQRVKELERNLQHECGLSFSAALEAGAANRRVKELEQEVKNMPSGTIIRCESLLDAKKWAEMVRQNRELHEEIDRLKEGKVSNDLLEKANQAQRVELAKLHEHVRELKEDHKWWVLECKNRGAKIIEREKLAETLEKNNEHGSIQLRETRFELNQARERVKELEARDRMLGLTEGQLQKRVKELEDDLDRSKHTSKCDAEAYMREAVRLQGTIAGLRADNVARNRQLQNTRQELTWAQDRLAILENQGCLPRFLRFD